MLMPWRDWPVDRLRGPRRWSATVNQPMTPRELARLQASEARGRPFGGEAWVARTVARLGLEHTVRPEGRPRKDRARRE